MNTNAPLTLEEQIKLMKKYVVFKNKVKLEKLLSYTGYFRASRYAKFLLKKTNNIGSKPTHNMLIDVYYFDVQLRKLLFEYCKYVEIQLKTNISECVSLTTGDQCFYLDTNNYTPSCSEKDANKRKRNVKFYNTKFFPNLKKQERELRINVHKYPELVQYRNGGEFNTQKIPCWIYFSYVEFGNICMIYKYLNLEYKKKILKNAYSKTKYSKQEVDQFITWIEAIKNLRNTCCHHNILVGKTSSIVLESTTDSVLTTSTDLFSRLYALKKLLPNNKSDDLKKRLSQLLKKINNEQLEILPLDWETRFDSICKF